MKNLERNKNSYLKIIKKFQNQPIFDFSRKSSKKISYLTEDITKVLPHRSPFLLIDSLNAIDLENQVLMGKRQIDFNDPVLKGHFPEYPVYPGVLQIEMMGQIAICLYYFLKGKKITIGENPMKTNIRLVKLNSALFLREILPGDQVSIISKQLEMDELLFKCLCQVINNNEICSVSISELYIV